MRWLKRGRWKACIAFAGLLFFLIFMVWVPVSAATHKGASEVTIQAAPTVDVTATMTSLQEEKLRQEILQVESQTQNQNNWLYSSSTALIAATATVIVALFGIYQWATNRRDEGWKELIAQDKELKERQAAQDKELNDRKEERRKEVVAQDKEIYGRYYTQIFDLAVAYLRLSNPTRPSEDPDGISHLKDTTDAPMPLTTLRQALIVVFREAFPLARDQRKDSQSLDASAIKLDNAYLMHADLGHAWLIDASLRGASLFSADFQGAELTLADFRNADLRNVNIEDVHSMKKTDLRGVEGLTKKQLKFCKARGAIIDEDTTTNSPRPAVSSSAASQSNDTQTSSDETTQANTPPPSSNKQR